jgi:hypothetical protein
MFVGLPSSGFKVVASEAVSVRTVEIAVQAMNITVHIGRNQYSLWTDECVITNGSQCS